MGLSLVQRLRGHPVGLTTVDGYNEYRDFVWPYFLDQQVSPQAIAQAWKAFEGKVGWQAFNDALNGVYSFKDHFKDFALTAWNTAMPGGGTPDLIMPKFQDLNSSVPKTSPPKPTKFYFRHPPTLKLSDPAIKVPEDMPQLLGALCRLDSSDDTQQLIVDFCGLQPDVRSMLCGSPHQGRPVGEAQPAAGQDDLLSQPGGCRRGALVLDDNSYASSKHHRRKLAVPGRVGRLPARNFNVTVTNGVEGNHAGAGTYSGQAPSIAPSSMGFGIRHLWTRRASTASRASRST